MRLRDHWTLEPGVTFLNHGSFGACPKPVIDAQAKLQARMHAEPVTFFARDLTGLYQNAREKLATFVGAKASDLVFVPNATTGVNTVLGSVNFEPGDEVLITNHGYNACNNAASFFAERAGAKVVVADVPFPLLAEAEVTEAIRRATSKRTKLALIDHITSPTGLVFPIEAIVRALEGRGIDVLVDGAHGPGMLPLDLDRLGAAYYTGNCHKWLSAGKGAAFLHVRSDKKAGIRPTVVSHAASLPAGSQERFFAEFDWPGTSDPSSVLTIPAAIDFFAGVVPGGWSEVHATLKSTAISARKLLSEGLDLAPPCPDSMVGSLASMILPGKSKRPRRGPMDGLHDELWEEEKIEVPVFAFGGHRVLRASCHLYNEPADYQRLLTAVKKRIDA
jgi:isopenicillin-N epimerase